MCIYIGNTTHSNHCFNSCQVGIFCLERFLLDVLVNKNLWAKLIAIHFETYLWIIMAPLCKHSEVISLFVHSFVHLIYFLEHIFFPFSKVGSNWHPKKCLKVKSAMTLKLDQRNSWKYSLCKIIFRHIFSPIGHIGLAKNFTLWVHG